MDYIFDVILEENLELEDYNFAFSNNTEWKSIYREIKLNYILEGNKKIQFDISEINKYITLDDSNKYDLNKVCCSIDTMTFILNNNNIEKITLKSKILDTKCGGIVKSLIDSGIEIKIRHFINPRYSLLKFIIETPN